MIGPKGKVINLLQAETGADITVDDDGMFGLVTIGAKDGSCGRGRPQADPPDHRPPEADVGVDLPRQGCEHHQVRCLRQHPPGP